MRYCTIMREDGVVGVDGVFYKVDLSTMDPTIHAVQWNNATSFGHVEFVTGASGLKNPNQTITDFSPYQKYLDAWTQIANTPPPPPSPVDLVAYANKRQWVKACSGYAVTVNGQQYTFRTDPTSMLMITGKAARFQQPNPPLNVAWQIDEKTFITIAAADFATLATEIADFVQSTFDTLHNTVLPGIADGTITTTAQIDGCFA